jgi:hypothetical protein
MLICSNLNTHNGNHDNPPKELGRDHIMILPPPLRLSMPPKSLLFYLIIDSASSLFKYSSARGWPIVVFFCSAYYPFFFSLQSVLPGIKLPQPQPHMRTDTHTGQHALRATQVRAALSHAYATTYHNRITDIL